MIHCPHCGIRLFAKDREPQDGLIGAELAFDAFWALYPRHVGKAAALKAWKKAATSEKRKNEIMAGLKARLPEWSKMSFNALVQFIPHASTWLNGERWKDEITANPAKRVIACQLCGDAGTVSSFPETDTMALAPCSCARGALPGLITGVYRVSTGERLGDVTAPL